MMVHMCIHAYVGVLPVLRRIGAAGLAALLFPLLVAVAGVAGHGLLRWGLTPDWVALAVILLLSLLVAGLERLFPHRREWNLAQGDVATDLGLLVTAKIPDALSRGAGHALGAALAIWASDAVGASRWPSTWPAPVQLLVVLLAADLAKYWVHRLSHEKAWLWPFHAVHHAPERIYVLNGLRVHPVNLLWYFAFDVTLPLALGVEPEVMAMAGVLRGAVSVLQHANLALRLGPLNWIFSTPELHRWHHSRDLREGNTNYGSTFIFWDLLFGTYYLPADRRDPQQLGVSGPPLPRRWLGQMLWPFCGTRLAHGCVPGAMRSWVR